jgi:hypothetical protein
MALQKMLENGAGNSGDYWRVDGIHLERKGGKMEARIHQYKSKADRTAGKNKMDGMKTLVVKIPGPAAKILLDAIYLATKTTRTGDQQADEQPYFKDAVDV